MLLCSHEQMLTITLGSSPVTYNGLSKGVYTLTIQATCPGQKLQGGPKQRTQFKIELK